MLLHGPSEVKPFLPVDVINDYSSGAGGSQIYGFRYVIVYCNRIRVYIAKRGSKPRKPREGCFWGRLYERLIIQEVDCPMSRPTFLFPPVLTERLGNAGVGTPTVMGSIQAFTDSVRPQYSISLTTCHDHAVEALAVALPFVAM